MKKNILSYIAGVITVIVILLGMNITKEKRILRYFEAHQWDSKDVTCTLETENWVFAEHGPKEDNNLLKPISQYYLMPKNEKDANRVGILFSGKELRQIWIAEENGQRQIVAHFDDNGHLEGGSLFGNEVMAMDKNLDGTIDMKTELPIKPGGEITFYTEEGSIIGSFGQPIIDNSTGEIYRLRWEGYRWEKVREN